MNLGVCGGDGEGASDGRACPALSLVAGCAQLELQLHAVASCSCSCRHLRGSRSSADVRFWDYNVEASGRHWAP